MVLATTYAQSTATGDLVETVLDKQEEYDDGVPLPVLADAVPPAYDGADCASDLDLDAYAAHVYALDKLLTRASLGVQEEGNAAVSKGLGSWNPENEQQYESWATLRKQEGYSPDFAQRYRVEQR